MSEQDNYLFGTKNQFQSQINEEAQIQMQFKEEENDETETQFKSFLGDDQYIRRPTNSIVNGDIITISDQPQFGLNIKNEFQLVLNYLKFKNQVIYVRRSPSSSFSLSSHPAGRIFGFHFAAVAISPYSETGLVRSLAGAAQSF